MGHKCKVRPSAATPPGPLAHTLSAPRVNVCVWRASPPAEVVRSHSLSRQELKRKLESADDSDVVMEQGKATIKSVKKELRLLQKAEEEQNQGESARATAPAVPKPLLTAHSAPLPPRRCLGDGQEALRGARRGPTRDRGAREQPLCGAASLNAYILERSEGCVFPTVAHPFRMSNNSI